MVGRALLICGVGLWLAGIGFAGLRVARALRQREFRGRFLGALAAAVAVACVSGWACMGSIGNLFVCVGLAPLTAALMLVAFLDERRAARTAAGLEHDPTGPPNRGRDVRWPWASALLVAIVASSFPIGSAVLEWEKRRAFAWVGRAAGLVRRFRTAEGAFPTNLDSFVGRLGRPPRLLAALERSGYWRSDDGFGFRIPDPGSLLPGAWIYDGATRTWSYDDF
jgi:hypothetical protein